ncbi:hypothetical protein DFR52_102493 [Hoeflea marina]|uniref:Uncharacterized protein n=1 Tax=Hoeflea marina TaxID=274592 RepID=A0A317PNM5_9HYPH|nr:hypothetical protein DFR52_102493 [Hoeflea marina]
MFRGYGPRDRREAVDSGWRASVARRVRKGQATSTYTPGRPGAGKAVRNGSPGAVARGKRARLVTAAGGPREAHAFGRRRARKGRSVQAVLRPEFTSSRAATAADTPLVKTARATAEARIWSSPLPGRHRVRHRRGVGDHANSIPGIPLRAGPARPAFRLETGGGTEMPHTVGDESHARLFNVGGERCGHNVNLPLGGGDLGRVAAGQKSMKSISVNEGPIATPREGTRCLSGSRAVEIAREGVSHGPHREAGHFAASSPKHSAMAKLSSATFRMHEWICPDPVRSRRTSRSLMNPPRSRPCQGRYLRDRPQPRCA